MGWKERLPAFCGGGGPIETIRDVDINGTPSEDYQGNYTTTSKYNLLTFVPKALFEQYRYVVVDAQPTRCSKVPMLLAGCACQLHGAWHT